jgi:hypothetical protein
MAKKKPRGKPGQRKGQAHYAPPKPNSQPLTPTPVVSKVVSEVKTAEDSSRATEHDEQQNAKMDRFVLGNFILAAVITGATVVQAVVGKLQWDAMETQNVEMIKQSKAAKGQLDAMKIQTDQTEKTLELMRQEQRAWLVVKNPAWVPPENLRPDETFTFPLGLVNAGGEPAFVRYHEGYAFFGTPKKRIQTEDEMVSDHRPFYEPEYQKPLQPGEEIEVTVWGSATADQIREYAAGRLWLYIVVTYIYDDALEQNTRKNHGFASIVRVGDPWVPGHDGVTVPWNVGSDDHSERHTLPGSIERFLPEGIDTDQPDRALEAIANQIPGGSEPYQLFEPEQAPQEPPATEAPDSPEPPLLPDYSPGGE